MITANTFRTLQGDSLLYVSFEEGEPVGKKSKAGHGYITVSDVMWGHEGPDWKPITIGPIKEGCADEAISNAVSILRGLGRRVVVVGEEKGEWCNALYCGHPEDGI